MSTEVRRFERRLAHRPEKVWRALTESSELASWFPAAIATPANDGPPARLEQGAHLTFAFPDEPPARGVITECEPPRVLAYAIGEESLRWELFPIPEGCLLVLTTEAKVIELAANDVAAPAKACAMRLAA